MAALPLRLLIPLGHSEGDMPTPKDTARAVFDNLIGGRWTSSSSGRLFENRNPADHDDLIGLFQDSTPEDAERAIVAAARAYADGRPRPAPRPTGAPLRIPPLITG